MGRKKKEVVEEPKVDWTQRNCFWRWKSEEIGVPDDIIIYTIDLSTKTKIPVMAMYELNASKKRKGGIIARQFKCEDGSKEHIELFKLFGLTDADEKKEKRTRKKRDV